METEIDSNNNISMYANLNAIPGTAIRDIAIDSKMNMYVTDYSNNIVWKYDSNNNLTAYLDSSNGLTNPYKLEINCKDHLYVLNYEESIIGFDEFGNKIFYADQSDGIIRPTAIAFDQNGTLFIADTGGLDGGIKYVWDEGNVTTHPLTINKSGDGQGKILSTPAGIDCGLDCNYNFAQCTVVTLRADANPGYKFSGWSGEGCSGTSTCKVTMDSAKSITAAFTKVVYLPFSSLLLDD